jgi:hypothetical protein
MVILAKSLFLCSAVRCGPVLPDNSECSNYEEVYRSDSSSDSDADSVYLSAEIQDSSEVSSKNISVDQLDSSEYGTPCSSIGTTTVKLTSACDAADVSPSVSTLERAEQFSHTGSLYEGPADQESEHDAIPITVEATKTNEPLVPVTGTTYQRCSLHARNRIVEESHACANGDTSLSADHHKMEVPDCPVLHPEMQKMLRLLLREACRKYNIESDVSELILSVAVTEVQEGLKDALRGKLLDRVFDKVTELMPDSETDQRATSHMFETLTEVSKEWKQNLSEYLLSGSLADGRSAEEEVADEDRPQRHSGHMRDVEVQMGGRVDKAVQTVSTDSVLFLKLLPDS